MNEFQINLSEIHKKQNEKIEQLEKEIKAMHDFFETLIEKLKVIEDVKQSQKI